jgi:RsiW-degrading membrane proteinase PrsW (M82 family)
VVNLLVFSRLTDIIALFGTLLFIAAISQKSGKQYRLWILLSTVLWLTYDLVNLSFGPLITHLVQLITIIVGMVVHDRKKETV